jgi:hypothetical protein
MAVRLNEPPTGQGNEYYDLRTPRLRVNRPLQHPRVGEQNAIEHAMQIMDRYNRLFLRTLRQLRDLRRYSTPITINNPQQVNIAADGGQQLNTVNRGEGEV